MSGKTFSRRRQSRHFMVWWTAVALMLLTLAITFLAGLALLGYAGWIWVDPAQSFASVWHPLVAIPLGLFTAGGAAWLFGYGLVIVVRVARALREHQLEAAGRVTIPGAETSPGQTWPPEVR